MEECEALCSKIRIMNSGHLVCIRSQHLKSRFASEYPLYCLVILFYYIRYWYQWKIYIASKGKTKTSWKSEAMSITSISSSTVDKYTQQHACIPTAFARRLCKRHKHNKRKCRCRTHKKHSACMCKRHKRLAHCICIYCACQNKQVGGTLLYFKLH